MALNTVGWVCQLVRVINATVYMYNVTAMSVVCTCVLCVRVHVRVHVIP